MWQLIDFPNKKNTFEYWIWTLSFQISKSSFSTCFYWGKFHRNSSARGASASLKNFAGLEWTICSSLVDGYLILECWERSTKMAAIWGNLDIGKDLNVDFIYFFWEQLNMMEMLWNVEGFTWDSEREIGGIQFWDKTHVEQFCCWIFDSHRDIEPPRCAAKGDFWFLRAPSFLFHFGMTPPQDLIVSPGASKSLPVCFWGGGRRVLLQSSPEGWLDLIFFFVDGTCMAWWLGVVVWFAIILRHIPIDEHESHFLFFSKI